MRRLMWVALLVAACSAGTPGTPGPLAGDDLWKRDEIVASLKAEIPGLSGSESPLADGRQRWLGRASGAWMVEVIGPPEKVDAIWLTAVGSSETATVFGKALNSWAPGSRPFFGTALAGCAAGHDVDESQ